CLDAEPDFEVVGQWADGSVAVDDLSALDPDIVLMDIELPGASGIEVTRRIRQSRPDLRVVILTAFADANLLFPPMPSAPVVATLRRIADGEHVLSPDLASRFLEEFRARQTRPRPVPLDQLSAREEEVLKLLATGETNREIARRLFVSEETIKSHVASIFRK